MLELVRGYAACVFDAASSRGALGEVVSGLDELRSVLVASEPLHVALTDQSIPAAARAGVLTDLLGGKVAAEVVSLATFPVEYERAVELPKTYELLLELAENRARREAEALPLEAEPPMGRSGSLERLRGYAEAVFERVADQNEIDDIEDELFRFARIAEDHRELRGALAAPDVAIDSRIGVLADLLGSKVRAETLALLGYVLRAGRSRDIVGAVDYLVELAAAERGRRVAEVRAAVELSDDERVRLAAALGQRTRRTVELRVVVDPSVLGGIDVSVGDVVIDGTIRHRLEQLRESLLSQK